MIAKFYCRGTLIFKPRNYFIIYGDLIEGHIKNGDAIILKPSDSHTQTTLKLNTIEFMDSPSEGKSQIALTIKFDNEDDLNKLILLQVSDQTIEIHNQSDVG